jgi:hypothetical protein
VLKPDVAVPGPLLDRWGIAAVVPLDRLIELPQVDVLDLLVVERDFEP